jgi:hypothetical protein
VLLEPIPGPVPPAPGPPLVAPAVAVLELVSVELVLVVPLVVPCVTLDAPPTPAAVIVLESPVESSLEQATPIVSAQAPTHQHHTKRMTTSSSVEPNVGSCTLGAFESDKHLVALLRAILSRLAGVAVLHGRCGVFVHSQSRIRSSSGWDSR